MATTSLTPADQLIAEAIEAHKEDGLSPEESAARLIHLGFSILASKGGVQGARRYVEEYLLPAIVEAQVAARAGRPPAPRAPEPIFTQSAPRGRQ